MYFDYFAVLQRENSFTDEEKEACLETVELMLKLSDIAHQRGVSALLEAKEESSLPFYKIGIRLAGNGWDPELVANLLDNYIREVSPKGVDLLNRMLMRVGFVAILCGESTPLVKERLMSYLGETLGQSL